MNRGPLIHLIIACVVLVLVAGGYGYGYSLLSNESAEVVSLADQIALQSNATTKIDQVRGELSQLSSQESSINEYFVATSDVVPFLEQIQKIGTYLGSKVEVVSVSATPGTPYGELSLSLTITGTFNSVARTIGAIEYSPYDTKIDSLTLNTTSVSTASSSLPMWTAAAVFSVGAQTNSVQSNSGDSTSSVTAQSSSGMLPTSTGVTASSTKPTAE